MVRCSEHVVGLPFSGPPLRRFLLLLSIVTLCSGCRSTGTGEPPRGTVTEDEVSSEDAPVQPEQVLGIPVLPHAQRVDSLTRLEEGTAVYETDESEAQILAWYGAALGRGPVVRRLSDRLEHLWEGEDERGRWVLRVRDVPSAMTGRPFQGARTLVFFRPPALAPPGQDQEH